LPAQFNFTFGPSSASGVSVALHNWGLLFAMLSALLFQTLYLHLLYRAGYLHRWGWSSITLIVMTSFLSFAAAEASSTYLFSDPLTRVMGINDWMNAPWIVIHVLVLAFLYNKAKQLHRHNRTGPTPFSPGPG
jgi:hypothetical protein